MGEYLRFAALGDSTTVGLGDRTPTGWRGWSRLLADALSAHGGMSYLNLAEVGATARTVRAGQLAPALDHRPQLASLVVGVNDTMRSTWDPLDQRRDLMACAAALSGRGATLLMLRFPDMANLPLPGVLARPLAARIRQVNETVDLVAARFDTVLVDLSTMPGTDRSCHWSVDRLHPSELGHRRLAAAFADRLGERGLRVAPVPTVLDGTPDTLLSDARWLVTEATPWLVRRTADLVPWALRSTLDPVGRRTAPARSPVPAAAERHPSRLLRRP